MTTTAKTTLTALFLIAGAGCVQEKNDLVHQEEKDQIISEVKAAAEPLMTGWAALDGNIAIQSFSPEMVSCYDTLLLDYASYRQSWDVYTSARKSIQITTIREDFIILTPELVIDSWVGKVEEVMVTGEKVVYNPIRFTNLFKKANGDWKIIFAQSTGIPVTATPV